MKKFFVIVAVVLFILNFNFVFAGNNDWVKVESGNNYNYLMAIQFVNANTGYIVGSGGLVLKTTNGGVSWTTKSSGISSDIHCVYFFDANTGLAAGNLGRIIRTTNGGDNWAQVQSPTTYTLINFSFVNSSVGYISGQTTTLLKTEDGGLTWVKKGVNESGPFVDCYFSNATTGIALHYMYAIKKTTNSGVNWTSVYTLPGNIVLDDLCFKNYPTGVAVGDGGYIVKTTNGGDNWTLVQANGQGYNLYDVCFFNETIGFAVGRTATSNSTGIIVKTGNRGDSWTTEANLPAGLNALTCSPSGYIWAVGDTGTIYRSINPVGIHNISTEVPGNYKLSQNYPNPFNPVTNIEFAIPKKSNVNLTVFDMTGKVIEVLVNSVLSAGSFKYDFNASKLSSGTYFYRLQADGFSETKKMVLVK